MAPPDTWHEDMVPLADFMQLGTGEREGKFPFIWTLDKRQHLSRLLLDETMVKSSEERRDFWVMLKAIAGVKAKTPDPAQDIEEKTRRDVVRRIAYERLLLDLIHGDQTLFVRRDEIEAQWDYIDHIRKIWAENDIKPKTYAAGTWGPSAAVALAERDGVTWHDD